MAWLSFVVDIFNWQRGWKIFLAPINLKKFGGNNNEKNNLWIFL